MDDYVGVAARSTLFVFVVTILGNLFGYIVRAVLARTISPAEYGLFYAVFTFYMFFALPSDMGYGFALTRFVAKFRAKEDYSSLFSSVIIAAGLKFVLALIIGTGIFFSAPWLALNYFKMPEAVLVVRIAAIYLVLQSISSVMSSLLYGFKKMYASASIQLSIKSIFLLSVVYLAYFTSIRGVLLPSYAYIIAMFSFVLFLIPVGKILRKYKGKINITKSLFKKLSAFAIPSALTGLGSVLIGYLDVLMLTFFRPMAEVGIYNSVLPTALLTTYFAGAVASVLFPISAEMWAKGQKKNLIAGLERISTIIVYITAPLTLILLIYPSTLLKLLFGNDYTSGALALGILAFGVIMSSLFKLNATTLNGIGKPKEVTKIIFIAVAFNCIFNLIVIPLWGMNGAALTTTLSYLLFYLLSMRCMKKYVPWRPQLKQWGKITIISGVFIGVVYILKIMLNFQDYIEAGITISIAGLIYLSLGYLTKIYTKEDLIHFLPGKKK